MATPPTVLTYGDRGKYDALINALEDTSAQANCGSIAWTKPLSNQFRHADGYANFTAFLHLRDWKWRGTSKKGIHILLSIQERIRCADKTLVASSIHSDYYFVETNKAKLLHSIHFDFDGMRDCHPLFHAQLCSDRVVLDDFIKNEIEFDYEIDPTPSSCFRDARIPTCDMTLPSVLLCLAADHFERPFFCQFREQATILQNDLPHPVITSLRESIAGAPNHIRSSHWFSHTANG
jgi:hypothetical protein